MVQISDETAIMREFGDAAQISVPLTGSMSKIVGELLSHRFDELIAHCPDAVFGLEPTITEIPRLDQLQKVHAIGIKMRMASPIYDYFYRIKEEALVQRERKVKSELAYQSRKNLWTRLCWKLGGFDMKNSDYLLDDDFYE